MANNFITSGVLPRALRGGDMIPGDTDFYAGDPIYEQLAGENRMLAQIENNAITGLSETQKIDLLAMAGIRVRRGLTGM